ncbi:MAG: GDP-L-fucose synthase [Candidatus Yanofskybacteria bacterium]|nr:GDP-L-fucose synthase [Candidatus Yanofskybacteria bacterium]
MDLRNKTSTKLSSSKILVTGGAGFVGSFVVKKLIEKGVPAKNILVPRSKDCDLRKWENCQKVVRGQDVVIHLAAKVGGIGLNRAKPGELFYDNIMMGAQLVEAARLAKVKKFVAIGTVCAYPKLTPIPFKEENLWVGYPEETNAPYGLAKKMLLVQAQAYRQQYNFNTIYLLPVNLFGPGDNFDFNSSHVIPALIRKVLEAKKNKQKSIEVWGTGKATREFLYVEDAAEGIILAAEHYDGHEPVNLGSGMEISIKNLVKLICQLVGYEGKIVWDKTKPDGQPRRMLDVSRAKKEFSFKAKTDFQKGLKKTIDWYVK